MFHDTMGQQIRLYDLVMFPTTTDGAHYYDRGVAMNSSAKNLINVLRVDGTEVAKKASDLTVVDRTCFFPGMAVTSSTDPGGQAGVITGVATALDLVHINGAAEPPTVVANGVSPAEVRPVSDLILGDYVVSGTWLGRVVELSVDVDVVFGDSFVCRVATREGEKKLQVVSKAYSSGRQHGVFYPRDVVAGDASVFEASRWIKGYWKPTHGGEGTVAKVKMGGVLVSWVASSLQNSCAPPESYHPNPACSLSFFCSGIAGDMWFWGVSDRGFFRHSPSAPTKKKKHRMRMGLRLFRHPRRRSSLADELKRPMAVADTHTTVDVLWQDGTRQRGVPSASLLRFRVRNEQDLFPGQRVIDDNNACGGGRVGIVKSLSYKDQTVRVSWITPESSEAVDAVVSTYNLGRSSDHNFFYGDIVVRRHPKEESAVEETTVLPQMRSSKATNDLSWVGHIVDLCDEQYLEVKWGDGNTSKVLLHEIAFVKKQSIREMLQEMGDWVPDDDEEEGDALGEAHQYMPLMTENNVHHDEGDDDSNIGSSDAQDVPVGGTALMGRIGNIIQAVIRTASGMLAEGKRYLVSRSMASGSIEETSMAETIQICDDDDDGDCDAARAAAIAIHDAAHDVFHFQHFDVVQSPQDHHYLDNKEQGSGGGMKWLKRVQKEWKILETSLPDTIYVRTFEDRMDLLRTVMVGASGTPYHDGLFFFDLQLPPSYPAAPPLVKYHSFGLRANPNLYRSGTVCLSLLNTFGGKDHELWSPETSSILQVIVSIQGLVLTAQPYYNEAGYEAQIGTSEGQRNELPYCENTYLINLHTMLHLIRRPPAGFEAFVRDHFRRRSQHILRSCEAYRQEGYPVTTLDDEAHATEVSKERSCSMGFRLALANVVPRLVDTFAEIGALGCL